MPGVDLRAWAVKGAEQRLLEIADEARTIFAAFPELRARGRGFELSPSSDATATEPRRTGGGRKRRRMSAAARKRIGDAQRKRWAEVKAKANPDRREHNGIESPASRGSRRKK